MINLGALYISDGGVWFSLFCRYPEIKGTGRTYDCIRYSASIDFCKLDWHYEEFLLEFPVIE